MEQTDARGVDSFLSVDFCLDVDFNFGEKIEIHWSLLANVDFFLELRSFLLLENRSQQYWKIEAQKIMDSKLCLCSFQNRSYQKNKITDQTKIDAHWSLLLRALYHTLAGHEFLKRRSVANLVSKFWWFRGFLWMEENIKVSTQFYLPRIRDMLDESLSKFLHH